MEDLSAINQTLHGLLHSQEDEETITRSVERYLRSGDASVRRTTCETLLELVREGDVEEELVQRRKLLLEDTSLTYIPILLPLTAEQPTTIHALLSHISSISRPREVLLALDEHVQGIEQRAEGFVVSDDEGDLAGDDQGEVDWVAIVQELELVLQSYTKVIPRLPNKKSTPTLIALTDVLLPILPLVAHHTTVETSRQILKNGSDLVGACWRWVATTSDTGGEQRAILTQLLYTFTALFGQRMDARLTERWFLATFPRFSRLGGSGPPEEADNETCEKGEEVILQVHDVINELNITTGDLLEKIINPSLLAVHASFAALNVLAASIVSKDLVTSSLRKSITTSCLSDSVRVLCAALSGSSVDAGVTWLWYLVQSEKAQIVEADDASMLIELLVPLTAQSPSPIMRLALFKLMGALINLLPRAHDRIALLKQLLEPANPFDNIRLQALSLLREQVSRNPSTSSSPPSTSLLTTALREELFPILFPADVSSQPGDDNPFAHSADEIMSSPWPGWWTECLNFLWFLVDLDKEDQTGVQNVYGQEIQGWLNNVERSLKTVQRFLQTDQRGVRVDEGHCGHDDETGEKMAVDGVGFMLARWEDALNRAINAITLPLVT